MELVVVHEEIDVSGGAPLERRHGLRAAVEAVEEGQADVVMVAYFDRLVRSLKIQDEVVSRVEAAGGRVVALDVGDVTGATAARWLSSTMLGMMSEYYRRSVGERTGAAQQAAVAAGTWPSRIPVGYARGEHGVLTPDSFAPVVRRAFGLRAKGGSIREVRAYLQANGIERSYAGVVKLLRSRAYLGEIHFGELVNLDAHPPLVDREVWKAAQRVVLERGPAGKSDRLLARLGVLRCEVCDSRMVAAGRRRYPVYRCNDPDCPASPSIMAHMVESAVTTEVRRVLADVEGRASAEQGAREAEAGAERAQADLDAAVRAFAGLEDEASAVERLAELRAVRDQASEHAAHLSGLHSVARLRVSADWDRLTLDEQRGFIRATVERVTVAPGRGADRIRVELFGEQPASG